MSRKNLDPPLERKVSDIGKHYEYWRQIITTPSYDKNQDAYEAANKLLEDLIKDIGEYSRILAQSEELMNVFRFVCDDNEDYKARVMRLDNHRRAVHNSAIQKFGLINRILAKNFEYHDKIIAPDNSYVGIYPASPKHLYFNPRKDIEIGVTQHNCREEIGQTMIYLAYYFGMKNL